MKRNLCVSTPAYLASQLMKGGEMVGVSLLASALLASDDDQEISEVFERMSKGLDPMHDLHGLWVDVLAEHPWMVGKMGPLVDWMDGAPDPMIDTVRDLCRFLATMSVWVCMEEADEDLLGRVIQTMRAIETRTFHTGDYVFTPPMESALAFLFGQDLIFTEKKGQLVETKKRQLLKPGQRFMDAYAGTGTRIVGMGMLHRASGVDPTTIGWVLQEADGMFLALAGVNMVLNDMGEHIELRHSRVYQDSLLAAHARGLTPVWDLPPAALLEPRW